MKKFLFTTLLLFLAAVSAVQAQVSFSVSYKRVNATTIDIVFSGKADAGWHIYSTHIGEGGPTPARSVWTVSKERSSRASSRKAPA